MEVADRIVLMNHGRIEQVGDPHTLYEHPENEFVMGFVGPVTRLGDSLIRPHDIEIRLGSPTAPPTVLWSSASRISASRCGSTCSSKTGRRQRCR